MYVPTIVTALAAGDQIRIISTTGIQPEGKLEKSPYLAQDNHNVLIYVFNDGKVRRAFRAYKNSTPWVWS